MRTHVSPSDAYQTKSSPQQRHRVGVARGGHPAQLLLRHHAGERADVEVRVRPDTGKQCPECHDHDSNSNLSYVNHLRHFAHLPSSLATTVTAAYLHPRAFLGMMRANTNLIEEL